MNRNIALTRLLFLIYTTIFQLIYTHLISPYVSFDITHFLVIVFTIIVIIVFIINYAASQAVLCCTMLLVEPHLPHTLVLVSTRG